jgi:hypothetical protein
MVGGASQRAAHRPVGPCRSGAVAIARVTFFYVSVRQAIVLVAGEQTSERMRRRGGTFEEGCCTDGQSRHIVRNHRINWL